MNRKPTAKKVQDLKNYVGEVALFQLSRGIKKGAITFKYLVVARRTPRSGMKNTTVFISDENGKIQFLDPHTEIVTTDMTDAFEQMGYNLI